MAKKRIILVDDEAYVTKTLAVKLRAAGHDVEIANGGEEGLALITGNPPDLVVSDYQMPVLSGFEMSVKLKEQPATQAVPILMLTARGYHLSPTDLARTNIQTIHPKPFSARELIAKIEEMLGAVANNNP